MSIDLKELTKVAVKAAQSAGDEIMKVYHSADFGVEYKKDDSPLTKADKAGHDAIMVYLTETGLPVLSEEGKNIPYETRKDWDYFWMVDPLDGTKEFIKKNGEFTVNIALIHNGSPILGVVYAPVLDWMYWANEEEGAWKVESHGEPFQLGLPEDGAVKTIVVSLSHQSEETKEFMKQYPEAEVISMGSSLKFMLVAENKAQVYPRFAPTMEWDTAAAHGVVLAMGGQVMRVPENEPLAYNKENLLNPWFIVSTEK
ncbi:3'(2'),5'-bisphosphate nucleotidase CysQ [Echinicola sp. CAU 1574]|uniref:3'(2'),5'-bisphosphate nucleotidase CysQ n=1 Tax=Echinicola arenosa TaxID=2774144 RepID=A0ABR9AQF9_9BACT|nr:3'(2'),5'-bisphosphate nucleotidase CysQ [Echinicola arenosa]MBD8490098.1 3'(2'),5'-bisphosphate nucleotidase CysQ [Echinicola arenosa]